VLRPFWLHQSAEYLIGLVHHRDGAAVDRAAVADDRRRGRAAQRGARRRAARRLPHVLARAHRVVDVVIIAGLLLLAVLPFVDVDSSTRVILFGGAVVLAVVWWNSAFEPAGRAALAEARPVLVRPSDRRSSRRTAARPSGAARGVSPGASPRRSVTVEVRLTRPVRRDRPDRPVRSDRRAPRTRR
jgi:hypothetical protein